MLFPTLDFAVFFLIVFFLSWALRRFPEGRKAFLVLASYIFYAHWDWRFCFLLFGSSLLNYTAGRLIAVTTGPRQRLILGGAVAINLGVLAFFKYYNFFTSEFNDMLFFVGIEHELPLLDIVLPVAISFFTFHGISYVVDVYRGKTPACRSLIDILLYISFFPQLVAGPIVRASMFLPQLARPVDPEAIPVGRALVLIIGGLFKKVVVATTLSTQLVDPVFMDPSAYGTLDILAASWAYAVQIYCDFSAYTDIATGVALLFGYQFPQNFNQPYRAASIQDFWRRWHISLSTWLREYLYIPLGGNRGGRGATYRNLLITMFLGGLWHGAGLTYVVWGVCHGLALAAERWGSEIAPRTIRLPRAVAIVLVFHFVCATWVVFRAPDMATALSVFAALGNLEVPLVLLTPFLALLIGGALALQAAPPDLVERVGQRVDQWPGVGQGVLAGVALVAIDAFGPEGVAPFIYFQF